MSTNTRGRGEGSKNVAATGTPEQLSAVKKLMGKAVITARPANTGPIAVGFSNAVRAGAGVEVGALVNPGESIEIEAPDLSQIWIDAKVNGEGVSFMYFMHFEPIGG